MDEGLDISTVGMGSMDVSAPDIVIEPLDVATETVLEPAMDAPELAELQQEAEALEIQPLDDGIDLGYDYDEAIQAANEAPTELPESSALSNILTAGADGFSSPSDLAQITAEIHPHVAPGTEEVVAQGLQAGWNMGVEGSRELMDATIRQHGAGPASDLQNLQIQQAIEAGVQPEFLAGLGKEG